MQENLQDKLAERVGVWETGRENVNEYAAYRRNACDVNDLAASGFCLRSHPFAPVCRFCQPDVTRYDTRRGPLAGNLRRGFPANTAADILQKGTSQNPCGVYRD